jgi:hypothetical protein
MMAFGTISCASSLTIVPYELGWCASMGLPHEAAAPEPRAAGRAMQYVAPRGPGRSRPGAHRRPTAVQAAGRPQPARSRHQPSGKDLEIDGARMRGPEFTGSLLAVISGGRDMAACHALTESSPFAFNGRCSGAPHRPVGSDEPQPDTQEWLVGAERLDD